MLASSFQTVVMVNHGHEKNYNDDDKHHHKISVFVATKMALKSNP